MVSPTAMPVNNYFEVTVKKAYDRKNSVQKVIRFPLEVYKRLSSRSPKNKNFSAKVLELVNKGEEAESPL